MKKERDMARARASLIGMGLLGILACLGSLAQAQTPPPSSPQPSASSPLGASAPLGVSPVPGASAWVERPQAKLRLISATTTVGHAPTLLLGLEFDQKEHWKIYWRSPGDAGYPPSIRWAGSVNLKEAEIQWPVPLRFSVLGIETVGYEGRVILPIKVTPDQPGDPLVASAQVDYLTCAEICVPEQASFSLILPPGPPQPSSFAQALAQARARVPTATVSHGFTVEEAGLEPDATVRVTLRADPPALAPDLFIEAPPGVAYGRPVATLEDNGRRVILRAASRGDPVRDGQTLVALVADTDRGVETPLPLAPRLMASPTGEPLPPAAPLSLPLPPTVWAMLGLAWLGGLILNLMPCVLPVLSLKILGVISHGGGAQHGARLSFLASSAGIVASFLGLALVAIGLKSVGAAVGWGIQFQQPVFLVVMAGILTLFAANLWGLFEIPLPTRLAALGGRGTSHGSLIGAFATGAFATLLATPCSAPFLGTAVGFALSSGPRETLVLFTAMGLGMATPYLLVALWPRLTALLPKPGPWMLKLRALLGLALAATVVWLLQVLAVQAGQAVAAGVAGLLALVVALLLATVRWPRGRRGAAAVGAACLAGAVVVPLVWQVETDAAEAEGWQRWSPEAVAEEVARGQVVLVDVTAEWCTTCRVNKIAVLERGPVAKALADGTVKGFVADWTRPDPQISSYLASFGRYGIPFNVVYGPGAPQGIVLSEILTDEAVLLALQGAAAP